LAGHSLLRRIRQPELAAPRRVVSDDEVRAAVVDHLRAMFSTRAGSAIGAPDYGIVSITDIVHECPDAIDDVIKSIRHTIKVHEPRLTQVTVKHAGGADGRETMIRFEISGEIINGNRRAPVKIETTIDATRKVRVE
jgi:type VI secretion system lysozyme-like protein